MPLGPRGSHPERLLDAPRSPLPCSRERHALLPGGDARIARVIRTRRGRARRSTRSGLVRLLPLARAMTTAVDRIAQEYKGNREIPLAGYAALMGAFVAVFAPMLIVANRRGRLPRRWGLRDITLLGLATHKLSRILARDRIAAPLRAPFTRLEGSTGAGDMQEVARGHGLRRALGSLATCQYCTGVWVAASLAALTVARPRMGRTVASVLAVVTVSDWVNRAYGKLLPNE